MVAAWRSAETEVGPAMARNSHGENGIWPDFEAAESRRPNATTAASGPETAIRLS